MIRGSFGAAPLLIHRARTARRRAVGMALLALLTVPGLALAAPAVTPPSTIPVVNDGYVTVLHDSPYGTTSFVATDKVCPLGVGLVRAGA